ncbi:MAG: hypothetical protein OXK79_04600 [Chloroflexota bacterium]|nr:hypothetical protein [Chloroflexota bacterium]
MRERRLILESCQATHSESAGLSLTDSSSNSRLGGAKFALKATAYAATEPAGLIGKMPIAEAVGRGWDFARHRLLADGLQGPEAELVTRWYMEL